MRRVLFIGGIVVAALLLAGLGAAVSLISSVRSRLHRTGASHSDLTTSLVLERSTAR